MSTAIAIDAIESRRSASNSTVPIAGEHDGGEPKRETLKCRRGLKIEVAVRGARHDGPLSDVDDESEGPDDQHAFRIRCGPAGT